MLRPLVRPLVRALTRSPMESRGLRPTLSLDFTNGGVTDSRVTYSGGANGTRVNSAGLIVAATTPRFDYNPVTLAPLGLLVEEARTNKATNENANPVTDAAWAIGGDVAATLTVVDDTAALAAAGLNGVCTSGKVYKFDNSAGVGFAFIIQAALTGNTNKHSISVYARTTGTANIEMAGGLGAVNLPVGAAYVRTKSENITPDSSSGQMAIVALAGAVVYFVLNDMEEGAFCTSVIVTAGAAVTRTADSAVMTGTNFSDWYNQTQGTFVVDADTANLGGNSGIVGVGDSSLAFGAAEAFYATYASANSGRQSVYVLDGGVFQAAIDTGAAQTINVAAKLAFAYALNNTAAASKGSAAVVDTSCTMPTPTGLSLGRLNGAWSGGANYLNGHVKTLRYYPQRLPNATLQGMTA